MRSLPCSLYYNPLTVFLLATCDPVCENGGKCLADNQCQCGEDFRGPQCQFGKLLLFSTIFLLYRVSIESSVCDPAKLEFNGGFNCTGTNEQFSCSLFCPDGIEFSSIPAPSYTCNYAEGTFMPTQVPQCQYGIDTILYAIIHHLKFRIQCPSHQNKALQI